MSRSSNAEVKETAIGAAKLVGQLVADEKVRGQLQRASGHAYCANRRMRSHFGLLASLRQMTGDHQLRAELRQLLEALQAASKQAERKRHHRLRNSLLLIAGTGAATVVILPRSRQWLRYQADELRDTREAEQGPAPEETLSAPPSEAVP